MIRSDTVSLCVPITARNLEELRRDLDEAVAQGATLVEYRRDYLQNDDQEDAAYRILRDKLDKVEIIFTYRDFNEGGETAIEEVDRFNSILKALEADCFTYLDMEKAASERFLARLSEEDRRRFRLILSKHDFEGTPDAETVLDHLCRGTAAADIVKAAYRVNTEEDLRKLHWASNRFRERSDKPLILIGMGEKGQEARVYPELLNSNLTFTPLDVESSSAPGQMDFKTVRNLRESFDEKKKTCLFNRTYGFREDDNR